jgi:hypothetical protein
MIILIHFSNVPLVSAAAASLSLSPLGGSNNLVLVTAIIISLSAAAALTSLSLSLSRRAALSSLSLSGLLYHLSLSQRAAHHLSLSQRAAHHLSLSLSAGGSFYTRVVESWEDLLCVLGDQHE